MAEHARDGSGALLPRKDPFLGDKREDGLHGMTAMLRLMRVRHDAPSGEDKVGGLEPPRASGALRATLLSAAIEAVNALGLCRDEAAARIGTPPETLDLLLRGQLDRFDLDTLVEILARLDHRVDVAVARRGQGNA